MTFLLYLPTPVAISHKPLENSGDVECSRVGGVFHHVCIKWSSLVFSVSEVAIISPKAETAQEMSGKFADFKLLVVTWPGWRFPLSSSLLWEEQLHQPSFVEKNFQLDKANGLAYWHFTSSGGTYAKMTLLSNRVMWFIQQQHIHMCRERKSRQIYTTLFWCQTDEDSSVAPAGLRFGAFICGFSLWSQITGESNHSYAHVQSARASAGQGASQTKEKHKLIKAEWRERGNYYYYYYLALVGLKIKDLKIKG